MVLLKPDPWNPGYGAGAEASFAEDDDPPVSDWTVETADWSRPRTPPPCPPEPLAFVDGVMRVDLRVLAEDGDARAWGLLGSFAAGGVHCDGNAAFIESGREVGRVLVVGGRIPCMAVEARSGNCTLVYQPRTIAGDDAHTQRTVLQRLMIEAEQRCAAELAGDHLVFADGPLHFYSRGGSPVVGVVKRMVVAYLEGDQAALLPRLLPGERSPIFALGRNVVDRYAWYQRLAASDPAWHELAGLVRCEVRMEVGLDAAVAIADRASCLLPAYAGRPGVDPRAPQNLTPVGALEARLRHLLGHPLVVRRALQSRLSEDLGP